MLLAELQRHISPCPNTGCWFWLGAVKDNGYGSFHPTRGSAANVHRAAYQAVKGPVPAGLELDHTCRVRLCCNPDHLEPVTRQVNCKRSPLLKAWAAQMAERQRAKTHCPRGHPYSGSNLHHRKDGGRNARACRACGREKARERRRAIVA
jgi:hypothetical protein